MLVTDWVAMLEITATVVTVETTITWLTLAGTTIVVVKVIVFVGDTFSASVIVTVGPGTEVVTVESTVSVKVTEAVCTDSVGVWVKEKPALPLVFVSELPLQDPKRL